MITAEKKFGSYVRYEATSLLERLYQDDGEISSAIDSCESPGNVLVECSIPASWTPLKLKEIVPYNHDTSIFIFQLPNGNQKCNLPTGGFFLVRIPGGNGADSCIRPYTSVSDDDDPSNDGTFQLLCKRYDEWGQRESPSTHFLYTRTDHSYRPPGVASNFIHSMVPGATLDFKHPISCRGKIGSLLSNDDIAALTMIAVGVGIAPMIQILRQVFKCNANGGGRRVIKSVLLYGVRTMQDILMKPQLEQWAATHRDTFKLIFCIGSRWHNVHFGAKTKDEYQPPPPLIQQPTASSSVMSSNIFCGDINNIFLEQGWVDAEKIQRHGFAPASDARMIVCGLPGVYDKLCGPRLNDAVQTGSVLHNLGYSDRDVIKL